MKSYAPNVFFVLAGVLGVLFWLGGRSSPGADIDDFVAAQVAGAPMVELVDAELGIERLVFAESATRLERPTPEGETHQPFSLVVFDEKNGKPGLQTPGDAVLSRFSSTELSPWVHTTDGFAAGAGGKFLECRLGEGDGERVLVLGPTIDLVEKAPADAPWQDLVVLSGPDLRLTWRQVDANLELKVEGGDGQPAPVASATAVRGDREWPFAQATGAAAGPMQVAVPATDASGGTPGALRCSVRIAGAGDTRTLRVELSSPQ